MLPQKDRSKWLNTKIPFQGRRCWISARGYVCKLKLYLLCSFFLSQQESQSSSNLPLFVASKNLNKTIKSFHLIKLFTFTSVKTAYIVFFDLTRVKKFGKSKFYTSFHATESLRPCQTFQSLLVSVKT